MLCTTFDAGKPPVRFGWGATEQSVLYPHHGSVALLFLHALPLLHQIQEPARTTVFDDCLHKSRNSIGASPVALKLAMDGNPSRRLRTRMNHALQCGAM